MVVSRARVVSLFGRLWRSRSDGARMNRSVLKIGIVTAAVALAVTGCSSSGGGKSPGTSAAKAGATSGGAAPAANWKSAQSAQAGGGMSALVAAAKKEGTLN